MILESAVMWEILFLLKMHAQFAIIVNDITIKVLPLYIYKIKCEEWDKVILN